MEYIKTWFVYLNPWYWFPTKSIKEEKEELLIDNKTMVFFDVHWSIFCKDARREWDKFLTISDCNARVVKNIKEHRAHNIKYFPTFRIYFNGLKDKNNYVQYNHMYVTAGRLLEFFNSN